MEGPQICRGARAAVCDGVAAANTNEDGGAVVEGSRRHDFSSEVAKIKFHGITASAGVQVP